MAEHNIVAPPGSVERVAGAHVGYPVERSTPELRAVTGDDPHVVLTLDTVDRDHVSHRRLFPLRPDAALELGERLRELAARARAGARPDSP
jgi:hypothetical protein